MRAKDATKTTTNNKNYNYKCSIHDVAISIRTL